MSRKKNKSRAGQKSAIVRDAALAVEADVVPDQLQEKEIHAMPATATLSKTEAESDDDRRFAERVPFAARVMVVRGESAWFAQLLDMSEGGCGIFRPEGFDLIEDDVVRLFFYPEDEGLAVIVPARIARVTRSQIGIEYHDQQEIPPARPKK